MKQSKLFTTIILISIFSLFTVAANAGIILGDFSDRNVDSNKECRVSKKVDTTQTNGGIVYTFTGIVYTLTGIVYTFANDNDAEQTNCGIILTD